MLRKEITKDLSEKLENYINPFKDQRVYIAKEVTFDYGTNHAIRVDYIRFKPYNNTISGIEKGDFYVYEIKSTVEDFHSPHGHNFIGDFNYYVMPEDVFHVVEKEIPWKIGVLVPNDYSLKSVKKTHRTNREHLLLK